MGDGVFTGGSSMNIEFKRSDVHGVPMLSVTGDLAKPFVHLPVKMTNVLSNAATFANAVAAYGQAYPFFEKRTMFRFTIGRTF